jgi:hypothetical protein
MFTHLWGNGKGGPAGRAVSPLTAGHRLPTGDALIGNRQLAIGNWQLAIDWRTVLSFNGAVMRRALQRWGLAGLTLAFACSLFAAPALIVSNTPPRAPAVPPAPAAAPADTNFLDPEQADQNPAVQQLEATLKKEGVKPDSLLDEHFLFASLIWGSIGGGYLLYAKKQREVVPFLGGVALVAASFMSSWFWMSLACVGIIVATHWLIRHSD